MGSEPSSRSGDSVAGCDPSSGRGWGGVGWANVRIPVEAAIGATFVSLWAFRTVEGFEAFSIFVALIPDWLFSNFGAGGFFGGILIQRCNDWLHLSTTLPGVPDSTTPDDTETSIPLFGSRVSLRCIATDITDFSPASLCLKLLELYPINEKF